MPALPHPAAQQSLSFPREAGWGSRAACAGKESPCEGRSDYSPPPEKEPPHPAPSHSQTSPKGPQRGRGQPQTLLRETEAQREQQFGQSPMAGLCRTEIRPQVCPLRPDCPQLPQPHWGPGECSAPARAPQQWWWSGPFHLPRRQVHRGSVPSPWPSKPVVLKSWLCSPEPQCSQE